MDTHSLRSAVGRLAPPGTRRRSALARLVDRRGTEEAGSYQDWIARAEDDAASPLVDAALGPLISVVVPAFNTPDRYLTPMVDSVIRQSYPREPRLLPIPTHSPSCNMGYQRLIQSTRVSGQWRYM